MLVDLRRSLPRAIHPHPAPREAAVPRRRDGTAGHRFVRAGPARRAAAAPPRAAVPRPARGRRGPAAGDHAARHAAAGPPGAQPCRPGVHRRARAAVPADEREGLHRHAARQVGAVHRGPEESDAGDRQRRRGPGHQAHHRTAGRVPERVQKLVAGRVAAGDPDDRYRVVTADGLPETWLDADKVDQILGNLIENAVRHGAGTVTVVVEPLEAAGARNVRDAGAGIAVSVRDEGDGVAPELVPRVFRQFWRAKRRGGAGLGLYIVKGLVEAHGGTITVQQAPEGGAEFRFTMPAGTAAG